MPMLRFFFFLMFLVVLLDFYFPMDNNFLSQENDKIKNDLLTGCSRETIKERKRLEHL